MIFLKSGRPASWNPLGLSRPVTELPYLYQPIHSGERAVYSRQKSFVLAEIRTQERPARIATGLYGLQRDIFRDTILHADTLQVSAACFARNVVNIWKVLLPQRLVRCGAVGRSTALQAVKSRVRFPTVSSKFVHWHNPSDRPWVRLRL